MSNHVSIDPLRRVGPGLHGRGHGGLRRSGSSRQGDTSERRGGSLRVKLSKIPAIPSRRQLRTPRRPAASSSKLDTRTQNRSRGSSAGSPSTCTARLVLSAALTCCFSRPAAAAAKQRSTHLPHHAPPLAAAAPSTHTHCRYDGRVPFWVAGDPRRHLRPRAHQVGLPFPCTHAAFGHPPLSGTDMCPTQARQQTPGRLHHRRRQQPHRSAPNSRRW